MNIAMISWDRSGQIYPVRLLFTILADKGHQVRIILATSWMEQLSDIVDSPLIKDKLSGLLDLIRDYDVIGLSFLSVHLEMVELVARTVKEKYPHKIIICGGVHTTIKPKEVLDFCDFACVGEGEISFSNFIQALSNNESLNTIPGIIPKNNDGETCSEPSLIQNLDENPIPKFFFDETFIFFPDSQKWKRRTSNLFIPINYHGKARYSYYLFPDRGCVGRCTYCTRPMLKDLMGSYKIRKRSVGHIINELKYVTENIENIQNIFILSDDFMLWNEKELTEFVELYCEEIGLPFSFIFSPITYKKSKIKILLATNLVSRIGMGIQSGSEKIRKLYQRPESRHQIMRVVNELAELRKRYSFSISYDFIIDCPWEDDSDRLDTLRLISQIPKPFTINLASLIFYPGTKLYDLAIEENYLTASSWNKQFEIRNYKSTKIRNLGKDSDIYKRFYLLASLTSIPYALLEKLWKLKLAPPQKIISVLNIFNTEISKSNIYSAILRSTNIIFKGFLDKLTK